MPTVTIYEVANSYVTSGSDSAILSINTLQISDDDGFLDANEAADPGTSQNLTFNGGAVDSYQFFYNDSVRIATVGDETVKTFQLVIGGVTRSFIMDDVGGDIAGADVGDRVRLRSYSNYTPIDYDDLPCFAAGTRIATPTGAVRVDRLSVGDLVLTRDHGAQPIRWVGRAQLDQRALALRPHLRPVRIPAACFGPGAPARDLLVSPQHRVLLTGWPVALYFGLEECLAPAIGLVGQGGIAVARDRRHVTYVHIMFDRHEIVFSEDLATESFFAGDQILNAMNPEQAAEISELFPDMAQGNAPMEPARAFLKTYEARAAPWLPAPTGGSRNFANRA